MIRIAFGAGVLTGILAAGLIGLWGRVHAAPPELTREQVRQVVAVNEQINRAHPHATADGRGLCWRIALLKREALRAAGIRAEAMRLRIVSTPGPSSRPAWRATHTVLDLHATVDGRPWQVALDMNADRPLDRAAEMRLGYRTLRIF